MPSSFDPIWKHVPARTSRPCAWCGSVFKWLELHDVAEFRTGNKFLFKHTHVGCTQAYIAAGYVAYSALRNERGPKDGFAASNSSA
jgi:hypothetical protein